MSRKRDTSVTEAPEVYYVQRESARVGRFEDSPFVAFQREHGRAPNLAEKFQLEPDPAEIKAMFKLRQAMAERIDPEFAMTGIEIAAFHHRMRKFSR